MLKKSALAACAVAALVAGCATAAKPVPTPAPAAAPAPAPAPKPALGSFGVDMSGLDASVKPGDDFFRYAGGAWLKTATMPSDRTRWGSFDILRAQSETDVRAIVDDLAKSASNPGSIEQKIGDFYNAYLDTAAIDAKGLAPAQPTLAAIAAAKSHEDIARLIGRPDIPATSPIGFGFTLDEKNPDRYIIGVGHAGLGLDEREYYLKTDAESKALVAKYQAHVGRMLALAGSKTADADAAKIVAFETEIAKRHWPIAKRRERELTYNLKSRADLEKLAPEWPWAPMFDAAGLSKQPEFVVSEVDAMRPLAQLYRKTPVATLRAYLTYHYLHESADVLPKAFDDENFDFFGRTLNGQPEQRARWKRAVSGLDDTLGEGVGQIYVKRHFSAESKAKMVDLVENLRKAYGQRIDDLTWMTPETKKVAREKLAAFRVKVGYPDKWRDYASLEIKAGDAFGNAARARTFEWNYNLARLDKPTDKGEWGMNPQTVNAYYNPVWNEIVFPAAILQPPFFDLNADPAVNYGGIGGVIGHEMGHGFDDQGAKSDARGVLRVWWNEKDTTAFKTLVDKLVAQYDAYEPLPGLKINGRLTAGENIGDNGGLSVAYSAYRLSLGGKEAPVLDGVTGDQRFYLGWAQVWRTLMRDQRLRNQVMTGPHSPPEFRVNGVVRNQDGWYKAFDVKPGDKLYLPPEDRMPIW